MSGQCNPTLGWHYYRIIIGFEKMVQAGTGYLVYMVRRHIQVLKDPIQRGHIIHYKRGGPQSINQIDAQLL
jgi:hypothetical protein